MKQFRQLVIMVLILTAICAVSGILLAVVSRLTQDPIRKAALQEKMAAIQSVLPACDNDPTQDAVTLNLEGETRTFYVATQAGRYVGAAFEVASSKGYGGDIRLMVGITADGLVHGIEILSQKETPGLGARIADDDFKQRFAGRSARDTTWAVGKDGGDIDAITAATISSRAVVGAVREGIDVYMQHESEIRSQAI